MSLHREITVAIRDEIDRLGGAVALSPTTIAMAVQRKFDARAIEPHLQYASLEHLKAMSRGALARRYDREGEENCAHQGDMFSGLLQDSYPLPRSAHDEPIYKPLGDLSDREVEFNIAQLDKSATARVQHRDALQAWLDRRRATRKAA